MLVVEGIDVSYGDVPVLWNVSINVAEGELVALIGSNGAGKSTLLRSLCGLLKPKKGWIELDGKRLDGMPPYEICELGISYVPEGRSILSSLSVLENLEMGAYPRKAREKLEESLEEVFHLFPILKERQRQKGGTLSGGQQQMLAIGRGLTSRPRLLILDEPSLGLAPKVILEIYETIKKLHKSGVTILLVEQNVHRPLEVAQRAYLMETGRIKLSGEAREVMASPHVRGAYLGL